MASDLPVIDLSILPSTFEGEFDMNSSELKKLREACEELGFFCIINHGIDTSFIQTTDSVARDLFSLPQEDKERATFPMTLHRGYEPIQSGVHGKESRPESMNFRGEEELPNSIDQISAKIWPHGNQHFRETLHTYDSKMTELAHRLLKLVILSLGLDVSKYYSSDPFGSFLQVWLRMNYYYYTNEEEVNSEKIYKAHTDVDWITILYQDNMGGLQIRRKDGKWINAKPMPGALVVNIGDCMQMWSNGRYHSAEHRVLYASLRKESRLSMPAFFNSKESAEIRAPQELIDDQHPQKYRTVKFRDMLAHFIENGTTMAGPASHCLL